MFLVFTVQVFFDCSHENVICAGTCSGAYESSVGASIPMYVILVPLLVTVYDSVFSLGGSPCPIRFLMVVGGMFSPMLWQDQ